MFRGSRTSRTGHTLAELMVVLTILSLAALVAIPRFLSGLLSSRLDQGLNAAESDLLYARNRAVATGLRQLFLVDPSTGEITVRGFHPDLANVPTAANVKPETSIDDHLPDGIRVAQWSVYPLGTQQPTSAAAQQSALPLTFYPEGIGDNATLVLEDGNGARRGVQLNGFTGELTELSADELKRL